MTEEEREDINPILCAEGLRSILSKYPLTIKESAVVFGAISLLYDCHADEWSVKPITKYDSFLWFDNQSHKRTQKTPEVDQTSDCGRHPFDCGW